METARACLPASLPSVDKTVHTHTLFGRFVSTKECCAVPAPKRTAMLGRWGGQTGDCARASGARSGELESPHNSRRSPPVPPARRRPASVLPSSDRAHAHSLPPVLLQALPQGAVSPGGGALGPAGHWPQHARHRPVRGALSMNAHAWCRPVPPPAHPVPLHHGVLCCREIATLKREEQNLIKARLAWGGSSRASTPLAVVHPVTCCPPPTSQCAGDQAGSQAGQSGGRAHPGAAAGAPTRAGHKDAHDAGTAAGRWAVGDGETPRPLPLWSACACPEWWSCIFSRCGSCP